MAEEPKTEEPIVPTVDTTITQPETPIVPAQESLDEMKQRLAGYEFKEKLGEVSKTYPNVNEFQDEIQKKVADGYSIEDASIIILQKNNKLQTAEQISRANGPQRSSGFGGSMDTIRPQEKKDPEPGEPGSAKFYADRFKELEAKGEIRSS